MARSSTPSPARRVASPPAPHRAARPAPGSASSPAARWALRALVGVVPIVLGAAWLRDAVARFGRLGFPMDDPYIHLVFARNLSAGAGWSFNPHQPVPGAT